jgi:hypothetical protein
MRRTSILLAVMVIVAPHAAYAQRINPQVATIIASYAAQYTCACVYVSHRKLSSCLTDLDARAKPFITLRVNRSTRDVTTSTLNLASAQARYVPRYGCSLALPSKARGGRHSAAASHPRNK